MIGFARGWRRVELLLERWKTRKACWFSRGEKPLPPKLEQDRPVCSKVTAHQGQGEIGSERRLRCNIGVEAFLPAYRQNRCRSSLGFAAICWQHVRFKIVKLNDDRRKRRAQPARGNREGAKRKRLKFMEGRECG